MLTVDQFVVVTSHICMPSAMFDINTILFSSAEQMMGLLICGITFCSLEEAQRNVNVCISLKAVTSDMVMLFVHRSIVPFLP